MAVAEKYIVIANSLEFELKKMRSEGISKLPSENLLAEKYSCSRQTVRAALDILQKSGLIEKRTGSGSYIVDDNKINKTVYFICEDCDRYLSPSLISGLRSELGLSKYGLKTVSTYGSSKEEASAITEAIDEKAAAIIIEPSRDIIPSVNERLIIDAMNSWIPVIYINSLSGPEGVINIAPDYRAAGKAITEYLKSKDKQKIACIFCSDTTSGMDEYKGYIDAENSSDDSRSLLISFKEEKEITAGRSKVLSHFIDEVLTGCDAVICQNGMIAHELLGLIEKAGFSVPGDLTIACFDNGYYSSGGRGGIISMGYEDDVFCKKLARTVIAAAEGQRPKSAFIPMRMVSC